MLENTWAREYLSAVFQAEGKNLDDLNELISAVAQEDMEDPLLEVRFLRHSGATVLCLNLARAVLALCHEDAPMSLLADLIETIEECQVKLLAFREELPRLRQVLHDDPENGKNLARIGVVLFALDDRDNALSAFTEALEWRNTLCIQWERDCLNNIGWDHYQRGAYEQALGWFQHACRLKLPETGNLFEVPTEGDDEPPYRLALENMLLTLARMGRLGEAAAELQEYHSHFGRLPDYEARALEKLGLRPDIVYMRTRIESHTSGREKSED